MTTAEKRTELLRITKVEARLKELGLRVLAPGLDPEHVLVPPGLQRQLAGALVEVPLLRALDLDDEGVVGVEVDPEALRAGP